MTRQWCGDGEELADKVGYSHRWGEFMLLVGETLPQSLPSDLSGALGLSVQEIFRWSRSLSSFPGLLLDKLLWCGGQQAARKQRLAGWLAGDWNTTPCNAINAVWAHK